ncbi:hypothetical protein [Streptomyces sp. H39-S7]|uniref:hypothetical protein n=1 Tax=Streptomyces sp. H39-S7 TaxID=3004357 RepID=UPI0022B0670C|nr:hypothetical protein [Streptomyces sp. H39-S7]MCZ4125270.1 hypothetical protein [Streptomyces sp. H39-S7]
MTVAQTPQTEMKDKKTGLVAADIETGRTLPTVDVMFVAGGEAEGWPAETPRGPSREYAAASDIRLLRGVFGCT